MGGFGWSLPPGCGRLPGEDEPRIFPEEDKIAEMLDRAGVDGFAIEEAQEIVRRLCISRAEMLEAFYTAAACKLTVRFEAHELSTTNGFGSALDRREPEAVAAAFVDLMQLVQGDLSGDAPTGDSSHG